MPLESPIQRDGDMGFIGFASRMNPLTLPAGMLQLSENMRLDRGVAVTRKGAKRMASGVAPADTPLTVPFVLTNPGPVVRSIYDGGIFASAVVRSPDAVNSFEVIVLAGRDRAFISAFDGSTEFSELWATGVILTDDDESIITDTGELIIATILPDEIAFPTSPDETIDPSDNVSMVQAFNRLYLLREASLSAPGFGTKNMTTAAGGFDVTGTVATVNLDAHDYPIGARVRIEGGASAAFSGQEYDILTTNHTADSFEIEVPPDT